MGDFLLRPPTVEDAAAHARAHLEVWRATYGRLLPAGTFDRDDLLDRFIAGWTRTLTEPTDELRISAFDADGALAGWASSGPNRDDDRPRELQLFVLNVLPAHHGSGIGQTLLDAAIGDRPASLWMAADNPRARRFYERNGFRADGVAKTDTLLGAPIDEVRLVR